MTEYRGNLAGKHISKTPAHRRRASGFEHVTPFNLNYGRLPRVWFLFVHNPSHQPHGALQPQTRTWVCYTSACYLQNSLWVSKYRLIPSQFKNLGEQT